MFQTVNKLMKTLSKPKYSDKCIQTSRPQHLKEHKEKSNEKRKKSIHNSIKKTSSNKHIAESKEKHKKEAVILLQCSNKNIRSRKHKLDSGDARNDHTIVQFELNEIINKFRKRPKITTHHKNTHTKSENEVEQHELFNEVKRYEHQKIKLTEQLTRFQNVKRLLRLERQLEDVLIKLEEITDANDTKENNKIKEVDTKGTQYSVTQVNIPNSICVQACKSESTKNMSDTKRNVTKSIDMTKINLDQFEYRLNKENSNDHVFKIKFCRKCFKTVEDCTCNKYIQKIKIESLNKTENIDAATSHQLDKKHNPEFCRKCLMGRDICRCYKTTFNTTVSVISFRNLRKSERKRKVLLKNTSKKTLSSKSIKNAKKLETPETLPLESINLEKTDIKDEPNPAPDTSNSRKSGKTTKKNTHHEKTNLGQKLGKSIKEVENFHNFDQNKDMKSDKEKFKNDKLQKNTRKEIKKTNPINHIKSKIYTQKCIPKSVIKQKSQQLNQWEVCAENNEKSPVLRPVIFKDIDEFETKKLGNAKQFRDSSKMQANASLLSQDSTKLRCNQVAWIGK